MVGGPGPPVSNTLEGLKKVVANELDAFLSLSQTDKRTEDARTWLLVDPVPASKYDRNSRIRDLVLRMATVRGHRVQAAFVSDPRDPESGLLRDNGRPGELLMPWRTTSRLIGNPTGELRYRLESFGRHICKARPFPTACD